MTSCLQITHLQSYQPIILVCQILGLTPFNRHAQMNTVCYLYSIVISGLWEALIIYNWTQIGITISLNNFYACVKMFQTLLAITNCSFLLTHLYSLVRKKKIFKKMLDGIRSLDLQTNTSHKSRKSIYIFILVYLSTAVITSAKVLYKYEVYKACEILYTLEIPYIPIYFTMYSLVTLMEYLNDNLCYLIEALVGITDERTLITQVDIFRYNLKTFKRVNNLYSSQTFLVCARVLINYVLSGYYLSHGENVIENSQIISMSFIVRETSMLLLLSVICSKHQKLVSEIFLFCYL